MPIQNQPSHGTTDFYDLPIDANYIPEELQIRARKELHEENENTIVQGLQSLRSLLKGEKNLRWQDEDEILIAFLRAKKYDVKRTFNHVKRLYSTFGRHERIYYNIAFDRVKFVMEENSSGILPYRNYDGSVVIYFHMTNWNPDAISAEEHLSVVLFGLTQALRSPSTQICGMQMIADLRDFTLRQFVTVSPSFFWLAIDLGLNCGPIRMRGFHVVNENSFFRPIWAIVKRLLTKKFVERIHVYGKDYKKLHKFVDPRILPAELDGMQPPFSNDGWREKMEASFDYLKHVFSFGYTKYLKDT